METAASETSNPSGWGFKPENILFFDNGDTLVFFPWGTYRLHSQILSRASEYLRGLFKWPRGESNAGSESLIKWTLVPGEDNFLTVLGAESPVPQRDVRFRIREGIGL